MTNGFLDGILTVADDLLKNDGKHIHRYDGTTC